MKILLVGANSVLGKALSPSLMEIGQVVTSGRKTGDIPIDLSELKSIELPNDIDTIIHLASQFGGNSQNEIIETEKVNVLGTLKLIQAALESKVKHFIFVSSIYSKMLPGSSQYSSYSISKKHAEEIVHFFCQHHALPLTILQPSQLYGPTDDFRKHQPFFYAMADKASKGEDISLNGKNDAKRNFIHVKDLIQIIVKVVQSKVTGNFACQYTSDTSISEIARAAITAFKSSGRVSFREDQNDIPDNVFAIDDSLYKKLNFFPRVDIIEGMKSIVQNRIRSV